MDFEFLNSMLPRNLKNEAHSECHSMFNHFQAEVAYVTFLQGKNFENRI